MKTALIRGPLVSPLGSLNNEPTPPIGLAYIASALNEYGFEVQGIDATGLGLEEVVPIEGTNLQYNGISIEAIVSMIDKGTKVIGISCMFSHEWTFCKKLMSAIKAKHPECLIIGGGEHCTALPEYSLRDCPSLDYIGLGEGEETMVEFCTSIKTGQPEEEVKGIAFIKDGLYVKTADRERIRDIDNISPPDWEIFPIEPYLESRISFGPSMGKNMPALATRGCPFQCTFCSNMLMWANRYVMRNVDDVIEEIRHYVEKYDIDGIQFYDLTAIIKKDWTIEFCKALIKQGWGIQWSLPSGTRSEALDEETLYWMAEANCRYLVYAPESGSPETLKAIKKKVSLPKMEASIKHAVKNGLSTRTNLIIGFPNETRRQLLRTLFQQLKFTIMGVDEAPLYIFQPYPGTELFDELLLTGQIHLEDDYFESLANFSTGLLRPPPRSMSNHVGRFELFTYRIVGMALNYGISYMIRPKRIFTGIYDVFYSDRSRTVLEQRLKDKLRRRNQAKQA